MSPFVPLCSPLQIVLLTNVPYLQLLCISQAWPQMFFVANVRFLSPFVPLCPPFSPFSAFAPLCKYFRCLQSLLTYLQLLCILQAWPQMFFVAIVSSRVTNAHRSKSEKWLYCCNRNSPRNSQLFCINSDKEDLVREDRNLFVSRIRNTANSTCKW